MREDFHYYATYCAAYLAGYSHEESQDLGYCANMVDFCTSSFLASVKGPKAAETSHLPTELLNLRMDIISLQNITRAWAAFHFLPYDLYAKLPGRPKNYMNRYRLICGPNGCLIEDTMKLAKEGSLQAKGIALHVLADTWAHKYFAGTPTYVINNVSGEVYEMIDEDGQCVEKEVSFTHNPRFRDNIFKPKYLNTFHQTVENTVMNLGHGRIGNLPDYSFAVYKYMPAWKNYEYVIKDNRKDYYAAFCQMLYALKYFRNPDMEFKKDIYEEDDLKELKDEIQTIIKTRRFLGSDGWKALGQRLSGREIEPFVKIRHSKEYIESEAGEKENTFLGKYFLAAMAHKSMVTNKIFKSKNLLAGFSVNYWEDGFKGIKDFRKLIEQMGNIGKING